MRVRPITLLVFGVFAVVLFVVGKLLLGGDGPEASSRPDAGLGIDKKVFARARGFSVPKFDVQTSGEEEPAPPSFKQEEEIIPPPLLNEPQEPTDEQKLREEASKDGFVFREGGSPSVYIVKNGTRFHVPTVDEFRAMGLHQGMIREVPQGSVGFLRDRPADGTVWRERDGPEVYLFEYGQKRWITNPDLFYSRFKFEDMRVIPAGALDSYPTGSPVQ